MASATMPLAGRRILLIGIGFYDYEAAIAQAFRALGADVRVEDERPPALRGRLAPLRRRLGVDDSAATARHLQAVRARARAAGRLDQVVVINGTRLDEPFLHGLRVDHPGVQLIVYYWDSLSRFPQLRGRVDWFDRVLTFDHGDAAADPRYRLRPNFFRPELATGTAPAAARTDISFVGWLHHDRLGQIELVRAQAARLGLTTDMYLSTGLWTTMKLAARRRGRGVHARTQPFADYVTTSLASRAILDLPHPGQTGLTMRALDALGAGRKLITTGAEIARYDFYRPENIAIIDAEAPRIDPAFMAAPMQVLPAELVEQYSLRSWALDVLGVTEPGPFITAPGGAPPASTLPALSGSGSAG